MPDWITHIAAAYILCTILGFRYKQFNTSNTVIAMVGALIPDIIKANIILNYLGYNFWNLYTPIHLPIGSFIIAGMISLFFQEKKTVFLFLSLGVVTHYALDVLMVGPGMYLSYPFYWGHWQFELISTTDFNVTIITVIVAFIVYLVSLKRGNKNFKGSFF